MVLHILSNDKFTDYVINQFKDKEMRSEMVVIPFGAGCHFKKCDKVSVVEYLSKEYVKLLSNLHKYSGIVLHGLFWPFGEDFIKKAPLSVKIVWCFWGGELYSRSDVMLSFLAPITKFLCKLHILKKGQSYKESLPWQLPLELYKRIDYCITSEYEEFEYAKKYTDSDMKHLWYTYYSVEETVGELMKYRSRGNSVLFCNSAAVENNMFDAALRLSRPRYRKILGSRQVIMPMGYGSPWIKNLMLKLGPLCFRKFKPIVDFLPRDQYNQMMTDCSTLILPYYSPAGQGNIITALWLGLRIYLSEKSIAYKYFKRIGVEIFSLESDFSRYGCESLTDEVVAHNRSILLEVYSRNHISECNKILINAIEDDTWL